VKALRTVLAIAAASALSACSAARTALPPTTAGPVPGGGPRVPMTTPHALPGTTPHALPAATLGCDLTFEVDQANCTVAVNVNVPAISNPTTPSDLLPGLHPLDLRAAYRLPSENTAGTVAIVDAYDDPAAESDLAVYRTAFGLPACTSANGCFQKVNEQGQTGTYPAPNAGWDEEIALDLDMVSAACANCKILLVEANAPTFDDLGAAEDTAAKLGATAIGNSYYGPEWSGETAYDAHYHHAGIAITVSAGDQQSSFYPAVSPYVTAVGGTTLTGSGTSWTESAWTYTGQGCSYYEPKPSWQGSNGCGRRRAMNDVAAVADPQTGVAMYDSTAGGWVVAGGTSIGAPLVAAAYALSHNPQSPAYSYAHRIAFHDVAPVGYDWPTGLGTPNGVGGL